MSQKKQTNDEIKKNHLDIRLYRAKSWFAKAENAEDEYTRFIALWIAFNALYAIKKNQEEVERTIAEIGNFLNGIARLDRERVIAKKLWEKNEEIRIILSNINCFQPHWDDKKEENEVQKKLMGKMKKYYRKLDDAQFAAQSSEESIQKAEEGERDALKILFERIYTLRNRIFHGGVSYYSTQEEKQIVKNINTILRLILPIIFFIMENNATIEWGQPFYCL